MELRPEVYTVFNRRMKLVSVLMLECSSKPKLLIVFIELTILPIGFQVRGIFHEFSLDCFYLPDS